MLGVSKELDNVRQREAALRETSGAWSVLVCGYVFAGAFRVVCGVCRVMGVHRAWGSEGSFLRFPPTNTRTHKPKTRAETTDSRIQWFSIFSIVILLAVATWQVVFLKQFFRSKKLL